MVGGGLENPEWSATRQHPVLAVDFSPASTDATQNQIAKADSVSLYPLHPNTQPGPGLTFPPSTTTPTCLLALNRKQHRFFKWIHSLGWTHTHTHTPPQAAHTGLRARKRMRERAGTICVEKGLGHGKRRQVRRKNRHGVCGSLASLFAMHVYLCYVTVRLFTRSRDKNGF